MPGTMWASAQDAWRQVTRLNAESETVAEIEPPSRLAVLSCDTTGCVLQERVPHRAKSRKPANERLNIAPQGLDVSQSHALKPQWTWQFAFAMRFSRRRVSSWFRVPV